MGWGKESIAFAAWAALGGCASVQSIESSTDTPLTASIDHRVVKDSIDFVVDVDVDRHTLSVEIAHSETCETITTPRSHRKRFVERRADPVVSRTVWGIAFGSLLGGGYSYMNANGLAANATVNESTDPDDYRMYGGGLVALGALALLIGTIDAVRASDSEYDDGVIEGRPSRERDTCRKGTVRSRDVTLNLPDGLEIEGRFDATGTAFFSLLDVPEESVPSAANDTYVTLNGARVSLPLSVVHQQQLLDALRTNPRSKIAVTLYEKRREECATTVASARRAVPHDTEEVGGATLDTWQLAKTSCAEFWSSAFEAEFREVQRRRELALCNSRLVAAAISVETADADDMTSELSSIRESCTSATHRAHVKRLEATLATLVKQREAAERQTARLEAAEQRRQIERARARRSFSDPEPTWTVPARTRACCKYCDAGKACGNSCIARWKTCHKGVGCACDS
jgi:hypothetical protein